MRIYLDTNAFIASVEGLEQADIHHALWKLFLLSEERGGVLVTSELALAEVLVKPLEMGRATLAAAYCSIIDTGPGLSVIPIDRTIVILAAHVRKDDRSIKLPDAIHLATAEREECSVILTDDRQMMAKRPEHCRPITMDSLNHVFRAMA